ncbi:MAG: sodium-dependent transporter, partial [Burkholderiaceae bacterium]|jgi:NSS family neurotransmitter:Na+ symporter|nr:sodium-dependent transporter [Burkholderiaceae bacterium]
MLIEAAGLAFFSLSLGMGCMITYGSYIPDGVRIGRSALCVVALTAMTCLLSGLIIIPALFAFGFSPAEGPGLTFIVMPALFSRMTGGTFFAVLFFVLLLVAALTSSVSLMEVVTRFFMDEMGMRRTPVCLLMSLCMFVVGIAASLSFGVWQHHTLFGMTFFQLLDSVTSCLMMPFGGAMVALLVGWKAWNSLAGKLTSDLSPRFALLLKITCRFFAPIIIAAIVLQGFWFALSSAATG